MDLLCGTFLSLLVKAKYYYHRSRLGPNLSNISRNTAPKLLLVKAFNCSRQQESTNFALTNLQHTWFDVQQCFQASIMLEKYTSHKLLRYSLMTGDLLTAGEGT